MIRSRKQAKKRHQHSAKQTTRPTRNGPIDSNGYRTGYNEDGDKVVWVPDFVEPGEDYPVITRRGDEHISKTLREFREQVWYNRHRVWSQQIDSGKVVLTEEEKSIFMQAHKSAKKLEKKYGAKNLRWSDFEWGLLSGRMSALAWVFGEDWEVSLGL